MNKKEATNTAYGVNVMCQDNYFRHGNVTATVTSVAPRMWGVTVKNQNTGTSRIATRPFEAFGFINEVTRGGQE